MSRAHYFLGKQYLGTSVCDLHPHSMSIAYFCSTCGDVWGRIVVEGEPFHLVCRPCEGHAPSGVPDWGEAHRCGLFQWWCTFPDSVSTMFQGAIPSNFPSQVLRREIDLMYEHMQRSSHAT